MPNFFNKYPYTDFHELNLDFILETIKKLMQDMADFYNVNVIKYADPIMWDITSQYTTNTIVMDYDSKYAYLSKQAVPAGVSINNNDYWMKILDLSGILASFNLLIPEMFGAVGDGITDDTAAFQKLSTAAALSKANIALTRGKIYVLSTWHLPSDVVVYGNNSMLKIKDNVAVDNTKRYYFIENLNESNTKIYNIQIEGNSANNTDYIVFDCITAVGDNTEVVGCYIHDAPDSAIMFSGVKNGCCDYNMIDGTKDNGIYVNSSGLDNYQYSSVSHNRIKNAFVSGIAIKRLTTKIIVAENFVSDCEYGITYERASTPTDFSYKSITCNNYIENVQVGLGILGGYDYVVTGNAVINCTKNGLMCAGVENAVISDNIFDGSSETISDTNSGIINISTGNYRDLKNIVITNNIMNCNNNMTAIISVGLAGATNIDKLQIIGNSANGSGSTNFMQKTGYLTNSIISNNTGDNNGNPMNCIVANASDDLYYYNNTGIKLFATKCIPALKIDVARDSVDTTLTARIMNNTRAGSYKLNSTFKQGDLVINPLTSGNIIEYANGDGTGSTVLQPAVTI